jgi:hypothetical protein
VSQESLFVSAMPVSNIIVLHDIKGVSDVIILHSAPFCTLFNTALIAAPFDRTKDASVNMNWARKKTQPLPALRCLPEFACRRQESR